VTAPPSRPTAGRRAAPRICCASSGASHVLFVEGSRNDYGFSLDITLRGVAGEDSEKAQGWCNFCTGPQMVTAAENVARPLVVHLAARPERAPARTRYARFDARGGGEGRRLGPAARPARRRRRRHWRAAIVAAASPGTAPAATPPASRPNGGMIVCPEAYGGKTWASAW
jgi:hypothetical protein